MAKECTEETKETKETNNKGETMTNTKTPELNLDFNSQNPLEDDLYPKPGESTANQTNQTLLLTQRQYDFIKQFQRIFLKHREQRSTISYEPRVGTGNRTNRTNRTNKTNNKNHNKPSDPIAEIAGCTLPYISHLNKYGDNNVRVVENYFCSNLTLRKLKQKHTKTKTEVRTVTKTKKNGSQRTKEIEIVKEYFDEAGLYDELCFVLEVLDGIEKKSRREEETMLKKAKEEEEDREYRGMIEKLVEKRGKRWVCGTLGIGKNIELLNRILNFNQNYPYYLHLKIKALLKNQ